MNWLALAPIVLLLAGDAEAGSIFRMASSPIAFTRIDPIVSPGKVAGHVHEIRGSSRFRDVMDTNEDMQGAQCTSINVSKDKSNYWAPALYYIYPNKTMGIMPANTLIYYNTYRGGDGADKAVVAWPEGMRILTGNAMVRDIGNMQAQGISWSVDPFTPKQPKAGTFNNKFMPNGTILPEAPGTISSHAFFPSCGWANQSLDSWDHFSHLTWPVNGGNGLVQQNSQVCPESHPISYPQIHFESFYPLTDEQKKFWRKGEDMLVLSNGDMTGATFHADFVNGWDVGVLQSAMDTCTSGNPDDCPVLFNNYKYPNAACRLEGQIVDEDVGLFRPITKLPGCNPLWGWDGPAHKPTDCPAGYQEPGYVSPNLEVEWPGSMHVPYVMPGTDGNSTNIGDCGNIFKCPLLHQWAMPYAEDKTDDQSYKHVSHGTQAEVEANLVQNANNAHPKVPGLEGKPGFSATTARTTATGKAPADKIRTYTTPFPFRQCPTSNIPFGIACSEETGPAQKEVVKESAAVEHGANEPAKPTPVPPVTTTLAELNVQATAAPVSSSSSVRQSLQSTATPAHATTAAPATTSPTDGTSRCKRKSSTAKPAATVPAQRRSRR